MKTYNKLPFKERKRQLEYSYNQTERQIELLKKKEIERIREAKRQAESEQSYTSEKDREAQEVVYEALKRLEKQT